MAADKQKKVPNFVGELTSYRKRRRRRSERENHRNLVVFPYKRLQINRSPRFLKSVEKEEFYR